MYSYCSNRHGLDSTCWMSLNLIKDINNVDYLPKSFADHNPILLEIGTRSKPLYWKLNTFDLQDKEFIGETKGLLTEFLKININSVKYQRTVWDTVKAYFRGITIKHRAKKKRERGQIF